MAIAVAPTASGGELPMKYSAPKTISPASIAFNINPPFRNLKKIK